MQSRDGLVHKALCFLRSHGAVFVVLLAAFLFLVPHFSYADDSILTTFFNNPIDSTVILISQLLDIITGAIGKMILTIIEMIVIPILGYNGFSTSNVIGLGWSLVRDVVNMFVVVILILIAIMTLVGYQKANWQQQLPRLFIAVVLVNFSRTICGFLIDISQVIMFTFVNALVDIASGNFANLLNLTSYGEFNDSFIARVNESTGTQAFQFLAGSYVQLAVYFAIFAVIGLLAVVFVYRIVLLWVLVILSPAAFFLVGVKDILGQAGGKYSDWWTKFSSALILGPMLTFFLWLALAAASGGSLSQTEHFPVPDTPTANFPNENLTSDRLLGLLIALALIVAGMQQAGNAASSMGGFAGQLISEGMGKKLVTMGLTKPGQLAGRAADRYAGKGLDVIARGKRFGGPEAKQYGTFTGRAGSNIIAAGEAAGGLPIPGAGVVSRVTTRVGGAMQKTGKAELEAATKAAKERMEKRSDEEILANLAVDSKSGTPVRLSSQDDQNLNALALVKNKEMQKKLKKDKPKEYDAIMSRAMERVEKNKDLIVGDDAALKTAYAKTKTRNLHLMGAAGGKSAAQRMRAHLDDKDTYLDDLSENALKDEGVQGLLKDMGKEDRDGKFKSKWQEVTRGEHGDELKRYSSEPTNPPPASREEARFKGSERVATLASISEKDIADSATVGALRVDTIQPGEITPKVARGLAASSANLENMNVAAKPAAQAEFMNITIDPAATKPQKEGAHRALYQASGDASLAFNLSPAGVAATPEANAAMRQTIERDPRSVAKFTTGGAAPGVPGGQIVQNSDVAKAIERALSSSDIKSLAAQAKAPGATPAKQAEIKSAVENIRAALYAQRENHVITGAPGAPKAWKVPGPLQVKIDAAETAASEL